MLNVGATTTTTAVIDSNFRIDESIFSEIKIIWAMINKSDK